MEVNISPLTLFEKEDMGFFNVWEQEGDEKSWLVDDAKEENTWAIDFWCLLLYMTNISLIVDAIALDTSIALSYSSITRSNSTSLVIFFL